MNYQDSEILKKKCKNCNNQTLLLECLSCLMKKSKKKKVTVNCLSEDNVLLVDKYSPKSLKDIIGNKQQIIKGLKLDKKF